MKFSIGDRVRLTGLKWGDEAFNLSGVEVTIAGHEGGDAFFEDGDRERLYILPDRGFEAELVTAWDGDPISPSHYKFPNGVEAIDITRYMDFLTGNAVKYLTRAGRKGDRLTDLKKALKYVQWAIEQEEAE